MPRDRYKVRVTKDHLVFCCGHFISYQGHRCERLHGHNYRTAVEVEGDLGENWYVFDFIALKHRTKAITDELDHRMLLPTRNAAITARWSFPAAIIGWSTRPMSSATRFRIFPTAATAAAVWRFRTSR